MADEGLDVPPYIPAALCESGLKAEGDSLGYKSRSESGLSIGFNSGTVTPLSYVCTSWAIGEREHPLSRVCESALSLCATMTIIGGR